MKSISELKEEYNCTSSEELFNIDHPPDFQCSKIDKIVKEIRSIEKESDVDRNDEFEDLKYRLDSINSTTYDLDCEVEGLRSAIEEARNWGQQWKDLFKRTFEAHQINYEEL